MLLYFVIECLDCLLSLKRLLLEVLSILVNILVQLGKLLRHLIPPGKQNVVNEVSCVGNVDVRLADRVLKLEDRSLMLIRPPLIVGVEHLEFARELVSQCVNCFYQVLQRPSELSVCLRKGDDEFTDIRRLYRFDLLGTDLEETLLIYVDCIQESNQKQ